MAKEKIINQEFKIYLSKHNKQFRLSSITKEKHGWSCTIKWIETEKYETFPFQLIEPYLK